MSLQANSKLNRIAICHMRSTNDTEKNRLQVAEIMQKAKEKNANVSLISISNESRNTSLIAMFTQYVVWLWYQLIFVVCVFARML